MNAVDEIKKTHKTGLEYAVLKAGVCFGVLNGMKDRITQKKTAIQSIEVNLIIFCEWL